MAIDPGHGGEDPGARGRSGSWEKDITLTIARKLKAAIDAEPGLRGVLTRDADYFMALQARVDKARRMKADLFVSVHADSFVHPHARGSSHGGSRVIRLSYFEHPDYVPLLRKAYDGFDRLSRDAGVQLRHETGLVVGGAPGNPTCAGVLRSWLRNHHASTSAM